MKMSWHTYALMTVFFWGVYGVLLHLGRGHIATFAPADQNNAGLKAFLMVCVAYMVTGVIAFGVLKARGSDLSLGNLGITWSLVAGLAGALGAFTLVLALGAAGPIYKAAAAAAVMPIVFAGAPIVNTIVAMMKAPPEGGLKALPLPFIIGCVLAASGAFLVAKYAPSNAGAKTSAQAKH
jgi:hypothetical protein